MTSTPAIFSMFWNVEFRRSVEAVAQLLRVLARSHELSALGALLDLDVDGLEMLAWGEPGEDVDIAGPRSLLETIAQDLLEGGQEGVRNLLGRSSEDPSAVQRRGRGMIAAAKVIDRALAEDRTFALA